MRVRTDENVVQARTGIVGKTFSAVPKENTLTVAPRPAVGKIIGGLKGGARRAALGDISNAAQTKVAAIGETLTTECCSKTCTHGTDITTTSCHCSSLGIR